MSDKYKLLKIPGKGVIAQHYSIIMIGVGVSGGPLDLPRLALEAPEGILLLRA